MNILDKVISAVSPAWGASRARHRGLMNAYEAASPSRLHKAKSETRAGNEAVLLGGRALRDQARWLDENHDIAIGILDKLEERVVGSAGIMIEPQPLRHDGKVHDALAEKIARAWAEWSVNPEVTGLLSRPEMERMVLRSAVRDGEVFAQTVRGTVAGLEYPTSTPFALECLESDFVPFNLNEPTQRIKQSVIVNAWGKPTGYHVLYTHPGETTGIWGKTKVVSAENMLHLAHRKRLHQLRGISLFHGVITRLADIKDYEESERVAARIAACLAFYIKKGDAADYGANSTKEHREINIAPGMLFDDLKPGEDVGMIESNRPNTHLYEFRNGQLRAVSAGTRASYSSVSRDYNGSYSSQRQELVESFEGYYVMQDWFIAQWARPVYRQWLEMFLLTTSLPDDVDRSSLFNAVYLGPVMPWINPVHESVSWRTMIRGGAATEAEWCRARGTNPREVKRQRLSEVQYNTKHNLVFDSDASKVSNAGVQHAHLSEFENLSGSSSDET